MNWLLFFCSVPFRSVRFGSFPLAFFSLSYGVQRKKGAVCSLNIFTYSFNAIAFVSHYTTYIYIEILFYCWLSFAPFLSLLLFRFLLVFGAIRWRDTASQAKKKYFHAGIWFCDKFGKLFVNWRPRDQEKPLNLPLRKHYVPCQPQSILSPFIFSFIEVILHKFKESSPWFALGAMTLERTAIILALYILLEISR